MTYGINLNEVIMIKIKELFVFGQVITAVIAEVDNRAPHRTDKIIDLRKGIVSEHAKTCARYHATKVKQGLIKIERVNAPDSHIKTVEGV